MKEYDSGNPRHVLASALAYECGDLSSEARYRRLSVMRLVSIAAARLTEAVDDRTVEAPPLPPLDPGTPMELGAVVLPTTIDADEDDSIDRLIEERISRMPRRRICQCGAPVAAEPSASTGVVVGDAGAREQETIRGGGRVEVRHQTGDDGRPYLDEVIARGADVHLESMSESDWLLILEWADGRRVDVWIGSRSGRAAVDAKVTEDSGGGR